MMYSMRTTVTLEPDVEALVKRLMREHALSFKAAVNSAIRAGLAAPRGGPVETPTFPMGEPSISLTRALQLAGELEDEELVRRLAART